MTKHQTEKYYPLENLFKIEQSPIEEITDSEIEKFGVKLFIKREDLNDSQISGNKLHKLKLNLLEARKQGCATLLTFGGAYSNHIYATAAAGKRFGFKTIGIIRGEEHPKLNFTLTFAKQCGMHLEYIDRKKYRDKYSLETTEWLKYLFSEFYLIPEGGTNQLAVVGCEDIVKSIEHDFDFICSACGTGGTLAGIIKGLSVKKFALGFSALKGGEFLRSDVENLLKLFDDSSHKNWDIITKYHFGGYAKISSELIDFIYSFEQKTKIQLEPIYTGKMIYGIYDMIKSGYFPRGSKIVAIHTGGLQGIHGMNEQFGYTSSLDNSIK